MHHGSLYLLIRWNHIDDSIIRNFDESKLQNVACLYARDVILVSWKNTEDQNWARISWHGLHWIIFHFRLFERRLHLWNLKSHILPLITGIDIVIADILHYLIPNSSHMGIYSFILWHFYTNHYNQHLPWWVLLEGSPPTQRTRQWPGDTFTTMVQL